MPRMLSPSAIICYRLCPRKFYYKYIERLPTKLTKEKFRGLIIHEVLNDVFDFYISDEVDLISKVKKIVIKKWISSLDKISELNLSPEERKALFQEILVLTQVWFSLLINKFKSTNLPFNLAWKNFKPIEKEVWYQSDELQLRGKIDLIQNINGQLQLMEYKTGEGDREKHLLQLGLYSLLYAAKHKRLPDKIGIYYINGKEEIFNLNQEILENAKNILFLVREKTIYEDIEFYLKNVGAWCKRCDFYSMCFKNA